MKGMELLLDNPGGLGSALGDIFSIACLGYILWRAQNEPGKLREWGLTMPITLPALAGAGLLFLLAVGNAVALNQYYGGTLSLDAKGIVFAVNYLSGAFPQQFLLCSIAVVTLEKLPMLRGNWRIPLLLGVVFWLGHIWDVINDPSKLSFEFFLLILQGVCASYYFLRFRTVLPLVVLHAIVYAMGVMWIHPFK